MFSFCHFLHCFVLNHSKFISTPIINKHSLLCPPLSPQCQQQKRPCGTSVQSPQLPENQPPGGGALILGGIHSLSGSWGWHSSLPLVQGEDRACSHTGAAADPTGPGLSPWGVWPFEGKRGAGLILIHKEWFFFQKEIFFFNFGKHDYIIPANTGK